MPRRKATTKAKGVPAMGTPSASPGRDRKGRFVKAASRRAVPPPPPPPAKKPRVVVERYKGWALYRGANGKFTSKPKRAVPEAIGHGERRRIVTPGELKAAQRKPLKGASKVKKYGLHGQSAPRLAEDNGVNDRPTFARWKGKTYRVGPEEAGNLADLLRVLMSDYVGLFADILESPQFELGLLETPEGDLLDFDTIQTMDPELADELVGNDEAENAADKFNKRTTKVLSKLFHTTKRNVQANKTKSKPRERSRTRPGTGPKGKGRDRK